MPYSLVQICCFRDINFIHFQGKRLSFYPENGGSRFLQNTGDFLLDYSVISQHTILFRATNVITSNITHNICSNKNCKSIIHGEWAEAVKNSPHREALSFSQRCC